MSFERRALLAIFLCSVLCAVQPALHCCCTSIPLPTCCRDVATWRVHSSLATCRLMPDCHLPCNEFAILFYLFICPALCLAGESQSAFIKKRVHLKLKLNNDLSAPRGFVCCRIRAAKQLESVGHHVQLRLQCERREWSGSKGTQDKLNIGYVQFIFKLLRALAIIHIQFEYACLMRSVII